MSAPALGQHRHQHWFNAGFACREGCIPASIASTSSIRVFFEHSRNKDRKFPLPPKCLNDYRMRLYELASFLMFFFLLLLKWPSQYCILTDLHGGTAKGDVHVWVVRLSLRYKILDFRWLKSFFFANCDSKTGAWRLPRREVKCQIADH